MALKNNALFQHSRLYLYERQSGYTIKLINQKIGKKGLIVFGSYELMNEDETFSYLDTIARAIDSNQNLFSKEDMYLWASNIL